MERGYGDIGYQYLIDESGRVYEGRYSGIDAFRAHDAAGSNVVRPLRTSAASIPATPVSRCWER